MAEEGRMEAHDAHVGDAFGASLSASSACLPGVLAVGAPTSGAPASAAQDSMDADATFPPFGSFAASWSSPLGSPQLGIPADGGGCGAVYVYTTRAGRKERPVLSTHLTPGPSEGAAREAGRFGHCVSVSSQGNWLAVGAPHLTRNGRRRSGAVFVYRQQDGGGFVLDQEIVSEYSLDNDRFGWSCSIDELRGTSDYSAVLVCGCWASNTRRPGRGGGFIQIYQRHGPDETWHLIKTVDPEGHGLFFGFSVAVSGDLISVGDPADNFEFKRHQGTLHSWARDPNARVFATPAASDIPRNVEAATCEQCGVSPIVGARYKCSVCPNYQLAGPGFFLCQACVDPESKRQRDANKKKHPTHVPSHPFWNVDEDASSATHFKYRKDDRTWFSIHGKTGGGMWQRSEPLLKVGSAVSQSDRYVAAGAPDCNDGVGLVFVRECDPVRNRPRGAVAAPDTVNVAPTKVGGFRFGTSVALQWPLLAVGSPGHAHQGHGDGRQGATHTEHAGAAYLFHYQAGLWAPIGARLHSQTPRQGARFGSAVALQGERLYVGEPYADDAPGCIQWEHVAEDGWPALSDADRVVLSQRLGRGTGGTLPQPVLDRAVAKVARAGGAAWPLARVLFVGEGRTGKTALRNALVGEVFAATDSTIGIETTPLALGRLAVADIGHARWVMRMEVEFDGVECEMRERAVAKECVRALHRSSQVEAAAQARSVVELMRDRQHGSNVYQGRKRTSDDTDDMGFIHGRRRLHGNDDALVGRGPRADREDASLPALHPSASGVTTNGGGSSPLHGAVDMRRVEELMRTSDEERESVSIELWDFGGQEIFYIMYHLFLSEFGTYVLTFSMVTLSSSAPASDREGALAMIRYWLDTIAVHTGRGRGAQNSPLALVGTHKDKVPDPREHENISVLLWSTFSTHVQWAYVMPLREGVVSTGRGLLWFFPVDNTRTCDDSASMRDPVLSQLTAVLEAKIRSRDYVHRTVPFSWLQVHDSLQAELRAGELLVSMRRVRELASHCGLAADEIGLALDYLDCMGLALCCVDERLHDGAVVLDTVRFLVRAATKIVCQHDIHLESVHEAAAQGHGALWKELVTAGVLDTALLAHLWRDFAPATHGTLLSLMKHFGLICPLTHADMDGPPTRYLVPALLSDQPVSVPPEDSTRTFYVAFSAGEIAELEHSDSMTTEMLGNLFMPHGLFPRVVAKCVEWTQHTSRDKAPLHSMALKRREAVVAFGPHRCLMQHVPALNSIRVHILVENTEVVTHRVEAIVASVIEEAYPKLLATAMVAWDMTQGARRPEELMLTSDSSRALAACDAGARLLPLAKLRRKIRDKSGIWVGKTYVSAGELSQRFAAFLPSRGLLARYDIFISYRWTPAAGCCMDSELAGKLFDLFGSYAIGDKGRRPDVFWDRNCLEEGRRFDLDFMTAMLHSCTVVPLVSWDALQRMLAHVSADRECDNVLLEWCLALQLQELEKVDCLIPIVIGRIEAGKVTNLFALGLKDKLPDVTAAPEIAKTRQFLHKHGLRETPHLETMTVRGIVDSICMNLGILLWDLQTQPEARSGVHEAAAARIMQTVEHVCHRRASGAAVTVAPMGDKFGQRGGADTLEAGAADVARQSNNTMLSAQEHQVRQAGGSDMAQASNRQTTRASKRVEESETALDESAPENGTDLSRHDGADPENGTEPSVMSPPVPDKEPAAAVAPTLGLETSELSATETVTETVTVTSLTRQDDGRTAVAALTDEVARQQAVITHLTHQLQAAQNARQALPGSDPASWPAPAPPGHIGHGLAPSRLSRQQRVYRISMLETELRELRRQQDEDEAEGADA